MYLYAPAAFDAPAAYGFAARRGAAEEILRVVVGLCHFLNAPHVGIGEGNVPVGQNLAQFLAQIVRTHREVVFKQGDAAAHAGHALCLQLLLRGAERAAHQARVGVVEHRAVHDVAPGQVVEGVAANLAAAAQHDVVAARHLRRCAEALQARRHGRGILLENRLHCARARHETNHDVVVVGENRAAAALAPHDVNTFAAAKVEVELLMCYLVAPHDHGGRKLPREEVVVRVGQRLRNIFFGGQVERRAPSLGICRHFYEADGKSPAIFA